MGGAGTIAVAGCVGIFDEPEDHTQPVDDDDDADDDDDDTPDAAVYDVEFLEFEETLEVDEDEALLYAGLDQDWDLAYSCEVGSCGQCTARVDGDANDVISHDGNDYLTDDQIEDGWLLTCVGYPTDDFAVETNVHPDDEETEEADDEDDGETASYDVEFLEFGETLEIADDEPLLYPALDEGWEIEYSCEAGRCGQCTARTEGDANDVITHNDENHYLEDEQVEDGWLLPCVATAEDDFALETNIHPDD